MSWLQSQIELMESLRGKTITRWVGIEMALRETDDGIPEFRHRSVNYLQMSRLDAELKDEQTARIMTSQNDTVFGLVRFDHLADIHAHTDEVGTEFYCDRFVTELPIELVDDVKVLTDSDVIAAVHISIGADRISMFAGEVYDDYDNIYSVRFLDESVLVQLNGERPEHLSFAPGG